MSQLPAGGNHRLPGVPVTLSRGTPWRRKSEVGDRDGVHRRRPDSTISDSLAEPLGSNRAVDGLGDHLALPRGPSSGVNPESGSICRFNSTPAGGTFRSSRSSAQLRRSRPKLLPVQPPTRLFRSTQFSVQSAARNSFAFLKLPLLSNSPFRSSISSPESGQNGSHDLGGLLQFQRAGALGTSSGERWPGDFKIGRWCIQNPHALRPWSCQESPGSG